MTDVDLARRVRDCCRLTGRFVLRSARLAEGAEVRGRRVLVIEDVVTSGGQIAISASQLRELGARVGDALCVIDRQQGGADALAGDGIRLHALLRREELDQA